MAKETELAIIPQEIDAVTIFTGPQGIQPILDQIKEQALSIVPDVTTAKGRKEIASVAYKVAQSKTLLDGKGKELVAEWKEKSKKIDLDRKLARDFLDELRDKVREPLTAWEEAEEKRLQAEHDEAQRLLDWEDAIKENELFDRQKEIERKEAEFARIEAERVAKEQAAAEELARVKAEQDRLEREARIAQEAKEKAEKEAQERIEAERIAAAEKIAKERVEAQRKAEEAELKRLADIKAAQDKAEAERKEAADKAEAEKQAALAKAEAEKQAIIKAQIEKDLAETARVAAENKRIADEKAAEEKRQANLAHRKKVNNEAMQSLIKVGVEDATAKLVVESVVKGLIKNISINY